MPPVASGSAESSRLEVRRCCRLRYVVAILRGPWDLGWDGAMPRLNGGGRKEQVEPKAENRSALTMNGRVYQMFDPCRRSAKLLNFAHGSVSRSISKASNARSRHLNAGSSRRSKLRDCQASKVWQSRSVPEAT